MDIYIVGIYFFILSLSISFLNLYLFIATAMAGFLGIVVWRREKVLLFTVFTGIFILRVMTGVGFEEPKEGEVVEILLNSGKKMVVSRIDNKIPKRRGYLKEFSGVEGIYRVKGRVTDVRRLENSNLYEMEIYEDERMVKGGARVVLDRRTDKLLKGYSREVKSFYKGVILGEKEGLSDDVREKFSITGTSHLIVISGLHIGVIIALMMYIGNKLPLPRDIRYLLVIAALTLYVSVIGLTASILRAYIMGLCYLGGGLFYEEPDGKKSFFTAMTVNLIVDPLGAGSISFQMSYMAVFSILFIYPRVEKAAKVNGKTGVVKMVAATALLSLVIQVGLTPIFMMNFRTVPIFSFLVNIVAIPIGALFVQVSFGALLLSLIGAGALLMPAVNILYYLLKFFIYSVAELPLLSLEYRGVVNGWLLVVMYLGMLNILYNSKKVYSVIPLVLILIGMRGRYSDYTGDGYTYYDSYPKIVVATGKLSEWDIEEMWNNRIRDIDVVISSRVQEKKVMEKLEVKDILILEHGERVEVGEKVFENKKGVIEKIKIEKD